jgi:hypothetical protein
MQQVGGLLVNQNRGISAVLAGQLPKLVRDGVFGHELLGAWVVFVDDLDHLEQAEGRQGTGSLQHLHHNPGQPSKSNLDLRATSKFITVQNLCKILRV